VRKEEIKQGKLIITKGNESGDKMTGREVRGET
jgi:hypothetical protein